MTTDPSDIVERLSDLARFYLNERPTVNPQERSPTLVELGEPEAQEIASELYKAINEIQSLRAALANAKAEERERCARVAEALDAYRAYIDSSDQELADACVTRKELLRKARELDPYDGKTPVATTIRGLE